jgi:nitroimidazol reductase NimA-like FMN-containing flavoprotein (pyridoxamine 5'-phosphate oxidase superfamily)
MRSVDARTGIQSLDRGECLRLLGGEEVGRLAVIAGGAPAIFPINFVLDGDNVVFRTGPGTKLDDGPRARACFEVDGFDRRDRTGWSVVVAGRLEEVTRYDTATLERLQRIATEPWVGGNRSHWMRLVTDRLTGRVVRPDAHPV